MTPDTILQALEEAGHGEHAAAVEAMIQPTIGVTARKLAGRPTPQGRAVAEEALTVAMDAAMAAMPPGESRFGGMPDLPPGAVWPDRDGIPMELVAQLRLADLAPHDAAGRLPASGSLLFFYNSQWESSDMGPGPMCSVLYHPGADADLVRTPPPRVEFKSEFSKVPQLAPRIHGLAALSFGGYASVPGPSSVFVDKPLKKPWRDFVGKHRARWSTADHHLLGYIEAQDHVGAQKAGDQLLFQIASDGAADFQWGDMDNLYFVLTQAELAARDFSNVRVYSILG